MSNKSFRGTKFVNPLEYTVVNESNVAESLLQFSKYVESELYNTNENLYNNIQSVIDLITLIIMRISSLEDWKAREAGEINVAYTKLDDSTYYGMTARAITNVSVTSLRLHNIEDELERVKNILQYENDQIVDMQNELNNQAYNISQIANFSQQILRDVKNVRGRLQNLESFTAGGEKKKLESQIMEETYNMGKSAGKIAKALIEWIPGVEGVVDAGNDLVDGLTGFVGANISLEIKARLYDRIRGLTNNAKVIAVLAEDVTGIKPEIVNTDLVATTVVLRAMETYNTIKGVLFDQDRTEFPMLMLMVRSMNSNTVPFNKLKLFSKAFNMPDISRFTDRIAIQSFICINYNISNEIRRQFVLSISNDFKESKLDINKILVKSISNKSCYIDRIQTYEDGSWKTAQTLYISDGFNINSVNEEVEQSTIMESYPINLSYNYIRVFLDCFIHHEQGFDLLVHNCCSLAREFINFIIVGSLPHWWDPECSRKAILAEITDLYTLTSADVGYPMPNMFNISENNIPSTMEGVPSMLDTLREHYNDNLPNWTSILS